MPFQLFCIYTLAYTSNNHDTLWTCSFSFCLRSDAPRLIGPYALESPPLCRKFSTFLRNSTCTFTTTSDHSSTTFRDESSVNMTSHTRIQIGQSLYEGYRPTQDASMRRERAISRQDEQRLFPHYSTRYVREAIICREELLDWELRFWGFSCRPSPNGVPIVPGETFKKSPGEIPKKKNPLQVWYSRNASVLLRLD